MRPPSSGCTWRKLMSFSSVAEKSFTGIVTRPTEIAPFHIERGMSPSLPDAVFDCLARQARSARIALRSRCLPRSLPNEKHVGSLTRPGQPRAIRRLIASLAKLARRGASAASGAIKHRADQALRGQTTTSRSCPALPPPRVRSAPRPGFVRQQPSRPASRPPTRLVRPRTAPALEPKPGREPQSPHAACLNPRPVPPAPPLLPPAAARSASAPARERRHCSARRTRPLRSPNQRPWRQPGWASPRTPDNGSRPCLSEVPAPHPGSMEQRSFAPSAVGPILRSRFLGDCLPRRRLLPGAFLWGKLPRLVRGLARLGGLGWAFSWRRLCRAAARFGRWGHQIAYGGTFLCSRFAGRVLSRRSLFGSRAPSCGGRLASGLTYGRGPGGGIEQLIKGVAKALREYVKIADRVSVGIQSQEDLSVIGGNSDGKQVAGRQRQDRIACDQPGTRSKQRQLWPGDIGDHEIMLSAYHFGGCPYAERMQGGGCKARDIGKRASSHRAPGVLVRLSVVGDLVQSHERVRLANRQTLQVWRDLTAQGSRLAIFL